MTKPVLIDISPLHSCCADHALEYLSKRLSDDGGFNDSIWKQHENPFIRELVEQFTQKGLFRLKSVQDELEKWLSGDYYKKSTVEPPPIAFGILTQWTDAEIGFAKIYLEAIPAEKWTIHDTSLLIDYLVNRYLPKNELFRDADYLNAKSSMMGKAQAWWDATADQHGVITTAKVATLMAALPNTTSSVIHTFKLSDAAEQIIQYGALRAAENVQAISDSTRHKLRSVVLDHKIKNLSGDPSATVQKLQQDLLYTFDSLNRDWRRIAITEAGEMANQGVIASVPPGGFVKRIEMYDGACPFCKKLDGRVFRVTTADDPDKDGEKDVWPGKDNIGRSASPRKWVDGELVLRDQSERWWCPAGLCHPNCRGIFVPTMQSLQPGDDPKFAALLYKKWGIKFGMEY